MSYSILTPNPKGFKHPVDGWEKKKDHPVTYVKWTEAMAYCQWLNQILNSEFTRSGQNLILRLPTEAEWEKAARGIDGLEYPWGNTFDKNKCNTSESGKGGTTPVGLYSPQGNSPYGCADMAGNVWEWTHSLRKRTRTTLRMDAKMKKHLVPVCCAAAPSTTLSGSRAVPAATINEIDNLSDLIGFRVVVASPVLS